MFQHTQTTTEARTDRLTTIKRLGIICLALAIAVTGLTVISGPADAHADHDAVEDPGKYMGPDYEHGVEDHGYQPAYGVQEGPLSDGYGGSYSG